MKNLNQILADATAAISNTYFRLKLDGGDPVFRERVYCYELYHQMRKRWPDDGSYVLNGEVDKSGHRILAGLGADGKKPDLLVHKPGDMDSNHAIIEVKHAVARAGIQKDIETLDLFLRRAKYERGIYLIYGNHNQEAVMEQINTVANEFDELMPIEIWFHFTVEEAATHNNTLG